MALSSLAALWFLPLVAPLCFYVCFTDMARMRITNPSVVALFLIYALVGPLALPFEEYLWRYLHLGVVLVAGMALNAGGALGAGDAKFAAAAAPFVHLGDLRLLMILFAVTLLAAFLTHRLGKHSALRRLAPDWVSWTSGSRFPMGLALGGTLALYLGLATVFGQ